MKQKTKYALNQASKHLYKLAFAGNEQAKKDVRLIERLFEKESIKSLKRRAA